MSVEANAKRLTLTAMAATSLLLLGAAMPSVAQDAKPNIVTCNTLTTHCL
jgi:hypothetical protein